MNYSQWSLGHCTASQDSDRRANWTAVSQTNQKFHHKFSVFECMKIAQNYVQVPYPYLCLTLYLVLQNVNFFFLLEGTFSLEKLKSKWPTILNMCFQKLWKMQFYITKNFKWCSIGNRDHCGITSEFLNFMSRISLLLHGNVSLWNIMYLWTGRAKATKKKLLYWSNMKFSNRVGRVAFFFSLWLVHILWWYLLYLHT